ncbi:MAG: hypothetical protein CYPHOPRED_000418 [Cyphobasidiales sp. Tagirdzhanova-0007]|nr:MAG: hypothetical protein CYPHOPRED_000418 [Cyphobasidiales sp. Tagirdzhanova-0007]
MSRGEEQAASTLNVELFSSLLPSVVQLVQLATSGVDATRQIEIARSASLFRDNLNQAKQQAKDMHGADLTIEDQQEIIRVLQREVEKRKQSAA